MSNTKQEIYQSSTLGEIPLSFTGRRLLQNLREEIDEYVNAYERKQIPDWEPLSMARGKIALYMSKLELAKPSLERFTHYELIDELARRLGRDDDELPL